MQPRRRLAPHERLAGWLLLVLGVPYMAWVLVVTASAAGEGQVASTLVGLLFLVLVGIGVRSGWRHTGRRGFDFLGR
jgi:hypothetical protein